MSGLGDDPVSSASEAEVSETEEAEVSSASGADVSETEESETEESEASETEEFVSGGDALGDERDSPEYRSIIVVPDDERVTTEWMTTYEYARAIAIRAQRIETTGSYYHDGDTGGQGDNSLDLAEQELKLQRSPLILVRIVGKTPDGSHIVEKWKVREMTLRIDAGP